MGEFDTHKGEFHTHKGEFHTHKGEFDTHKGEFDTHLEIIVENSNVEKVENTINTTYNSINIHIYVC